MNTIKTHYGIDDIVYVDSSVKTRITGICIYSKKHIEYQLSFMDGTTYVSKWVNEIVIDDIMFPEGKEENQKIT